jgi:hypothetical protein
MRVGFHAVNRTVALPCFRITCSRLLLGLSIVLALHCLGYSQAGSPTDMSQRTFVPTPTPGSGHDYFPYAHGDGEPR